MEKELSELSKSKNKAPFLSDEDIHALFDALNPDRQNMGPVRRKLSKLRGSFERYVNNQKMKRLTKAAQKNLKKPEFLTQQEIEALLSAVGKGPDHNLKNQDDGRAVSMNADNEREM